MSEKQLLKLEAKNGPTPYDSSVIVGFETLAGARGRISVLLGSAIVSVRIVQELCESRGGRPGLSVLTSLLVSVDVKNY